MIKNGVSEYTNRAKIKGFIKYMMANPVYFEYITGQPCLFDNVINEYKKMEKNGLIASAGVSPHCTCDFCMQGKKYRVYWGCK